MKQQRPRGFGYREPFAPRYKRVRQSQGFVFFTFFMMVVLVIVAIVVGYLLWSNTRNTVHNCTVTDKSAVSKSQDDGGGTDYRVYTKNCGTFSVADAPFFGKFNSADTYGAIQEGKTYTFETIGFRNGFFSWFPNIIEVELQ